MKANCSGVGATLLRREGCMGAVRAAWTRRGGGSAAECSGVGATLRRHGGGGVGRRVRGVEAA